MSETSVSVSFPVRKPEGLCENGEAIFKQCADHFNEVVLAFGSVARLCGFGQDPQDYYYLMRNPTWPTRGELAWSSAVGGFIALKGKIDQADYERLEYYMSLNNAGPEPQMLVLNEPAHD